MFFLEAEFNQYGFHFLVILDFSGGQKELSSEDVDTG